MQRGGTVLSEYGVSLQDSIGLITAANEAIQDPAKVGNALKTISINMAGIKSNASNGTMELNKTAKTLKEIAGIDVYSDKSKGQVKDMVQILDELNKKLEAGKLNQDEFYAVSEALAGKENAAVLQSLMSNYDTFKQIQSEFNEGLHFGSAEKENAAYVDSLEGKLNHLKEVWIDTLMVLADSDSLKGLLDVFISISEGINTFIKALDGVGMTFPVLLGLLSGGSGAFKSLGKSLDLAEEASNGLGLGVKGVGKALLSGAVPAIKSFLTQGALIGGVTLAVQGVAWAWDELTNGVKKAAEELQSIEDEQLSNISAQNQKIKSLETIGVEYEKLANKAKKTKEEEAQMLELGNELAKILPEMVIGYDEENNAILHMTDDMEGLIEKTKEAKSQYEKLLLGTRMEQSDNALKMLTDGEKSGKDKLGLYDQKAKVQEDYYNRMANLQLAYQVQLKNATEFEGDTRETALKRMREIRNEMLVEESNYQTQYLDIQSRILEYSNMFREEMDSVWRTSADLLINDLTPELQSGIEGFINALDFSEISDENELEAVRKVFRELPELAQNGAIDVGKLTTQIADINKEFADTKNLEDYNTNMQALAKAVSAETGWDANVLLELFTQITDGSLKSATSLDNFLDTFGKTKKQIEDGDSVAKVLHTQFVEMERVLEKIGTLDLSDKKVALNLRTELQNNADIPKQIRDTINKLVDAGVEDKYTVSIAGELMMSLKDGKLDEGEVDRLKTNLREQLKGKMDKEEIEMTINGILNSFNSEEIIKAIEDELGDQKVTKEVIIEADSPEGINAINEAIKLLESRPEVNKAVRAVVEGDEDLVIFSEIIKNLPVNKDYTNKFIIENAEALYQLKSYQEVLDYINSLPEEVRKTYGIKSEGLTETAEKVEQIDDTINSVNGNELKVTSSNDDVLQTIEDVKTLIEISAKVEDGKYKIDIDANTQKAIDNINAFKDAVNGLNKEIGSGKSVSYKADTSQAAKNISGLITRVKQIKDLNGKTFKYHSVTALAAQNISGLIKRIDEINKKNGKTFTWNAETAQAAKNISGLIKRIDEINGKKSKSFTYTTTVKEETVAETDTSIAIPDTVSDSVSPISAVADEIAGQTSRIQSSLRTGVGEISSFSSNMARITSRTPINLSVGNINNSIKYGVELLQELENRIDKVNNSISLLDKKMESAVGTNKINYLKEQNELYKEQVQLQRELEEALKSQQATYKNYLQGKGFNFNSDGNLTNYEEKLIAMKKEEARLKELADAANDRYNDYSGDNETYKQQLKSSYESAKNSADAYSDSLGEIEKYLEEYIKTTFTEIPKVSEEWQNLQNAIQENNKEIENLNRENKLYWFNNGLKNTKMQLEGISDELDILSKKMELDGINSNNISRYISLLRQQSTLQQHIISDYKNSMEVYRADLSKYGFIFDGNGSISNLNSILNNYQNSSDLEHITSIVDEYLSLLNDELPDAEKAWLDIQLAIKEQEKSLKELAKNQELEKYTNKILELNNALTSISNELDIISSKLEYAYGREKLELLDQQIKKYREQQQIQKNLIDQYTRQMQVYKRELAQLGFMFGSDGSVLNMESILGKFTGEELEEVKNLLNEYLSIQNGDLSDAKNEWQELENAIKDVLQTQLDTTKEIEDKITDIYKKQIKERIDALNKETDAKLEALKKQQDAYNKYREEVDYQNEYDEKLSAITDLQKQLDIAMKDTSLNGQKKVKDLQVEIAKAQAELQKLTQDKIDQNINDMFDKESERIEEENQKNIEELESQWSESKIAEMVAQALGSGVFIDIEGNVSSLEDALVDFAQETGELFGVLGSIVKSELITNLEIAKDTVKDLSSVLKEFDLVGYTSSQTSRSIDTITSRMVTSGSYSSSLGNQVSITAPIINIEGNVDNNVVEELKNISNKIKEEVVNAIATSIR